MIHGRHLKQKHREKECLVLIEKNLEFLRYLFGKISKTSKEHDHIVHILYILELNFQEIKIMLNDKDCAVREIINCMEKERERIESDIQCNINNVIIPLIEKVKMHTSDLDCAALLHVHLENIASRYGRRILAKGLNLSPRELEICHFVRANLSSKEISQLLNISQQTVSRHRKNIRKKLGICNRDVNLTGYLNDL